MHFSLTSKICVSTLFTLISLQAVFGQTADSWHRIPLAPAPFVADRLVETSDAVFALAYGELYRADTGFGESWTELDFLPDSLYASWMWSSNDLLVILTNPLIGTRDEVERSYLYVSEDHGETFQERAELNITDSGGLPDVFVAGMHLGYVDGSSGVASSPQRYYRSEDAGRTWLEVPRFALIRMREPAEGILLRNRFDQGNILERSLDGGLTWDDLSAPNGYRLSVFGTFALGDTIAWAVDDTLNLYHPSSDYFEQEVLSDDYRLDNPRMRHGIILDRVKNPSRYSINRGRDWNLIDTVHSQTFIGGLPSAALTNNGILITYRSNAIRVKQPDQIIRLATAITDQYAVSDVLPITNDILSPVIHNLNRGSLVQLNGNEVRDFEVATYEVAQGDINGVNFQLAPYSFDQILRSEDGFSTADTLDYNVSHFSLQCKGDRCAFASNRDSIYLSTDGGMSWRNKSAEWSVEQSGLGTLALLNDGLCYTQTTNFITTNLICRNDDGSDIRRLLSVPWIQLAFARRATSPLTQQQLYIGTGLGYQIGQEGRTLRLLDMTGFPRLEHHNQKYAAPQRVIVVGDTIAALGSAGVPYLSIDGGDNWVPWTTDLPSSYITSGTLLGDIPILSTLKGVYYYGQLVSDVQDDNSNDDASLITAFPNPSQPGAKMTIMLPKCESSSQNIKAIAIDGSGRFTPLLLNTIDSELNSYSIKAPAQSGSYTIMIAAGKGCMGAAQIIVQ